jgi:hypothetical protein
VLTNASKLASGPIGITKLEGTVALGQRGRYADSGSALSSTSV